MKEIKPPLAYNEFPGPKIFLAGTIDQGNSEDWQARVANDLSEHEGVLLNPRRDDWDSSWECTLDNPEFVEQVGWEQDGLQDSDLIVFYFASDSKSPITLLELGVCLGHNNNSTLVVCCPSDFYRAGNVEYMCSRFGIRMVNDYDSMLREVKYNLEIFEEYGYLPFPN